MYFKWDPTHLYALYWYTLCILLCIHNGIHYVYHYVYIIYTNTKHVSVWDPITHLKQIKDLYFYVRA